MDPRAIFSIQLLVSIAFAANSSIAAEVKLRKCRPELLIHALSGDPLPQITEVRLDVSVSEYFPALLENRSDFMAKVRNPIKTKTLRKLINFGLLHKGKTIPHSPSSILDLLTPGQRYSFVIQGNRLVFAPMDKTFIRDNLSKHSLLADGHSVHYAGTLWKDENGIFFFSNNSGTYQPSPELTSQAMRFFKDVLETDRIRTEIVDR